MIEWKEETGKEASKNIKEHYKGTQFMLSELRMSGESPPTNLWENLSHGSSYQLADTPNTPSAKPIPSSTLKWLLTQAPRLAAKTN